MRKNSFVLTLLVLLVLFVAMSFVAPAYANPGAILQFFLGFVLGMFVGGFCVTLIVLYTLKGNVDDEV